VKVPLLYLVAEATKFNPKGRDPDNLHGSLKLERWEIR
jgi:hypothetical protein